MTDIDTCPHCGADLRGAEIPEERRQFYGAGATEARTHYSRVLGIELRGVYDGFWHRFPEGHPLHARAARALTEWENR